MLLYYVEAEQHLVKIRKKVLEYVAILKCRLWLCSLLYTLYSHL